MQSLSLHQNSGYQPAAMINRNQPVSVDKHDQIRDAVRAWAGVDGQDVVSALIVEEYRAQGGDEITFPDDLSRQRQKLFRFLDNHFNSERYRENVRQLTPAILAVLPLEFRNRLLPEDNVMARLARLEKETSEAKIAVAMNAPRHQKLKELSEGIVEMFRVDLCKVDLLVLDEVGIQRGSNGEKVILNQIIDRRLSSMRPVGILTNLNHEELLGALGARVIDRLQMDGGMWVNFDWGSYRKNVSHLRSVK